jgi:MinD superfamily P-loop ATPase
MDEGMVTMRGQRRRSTASSRDLRIVIASGKGGTGKTTIATSLAVVMAAEGCRVAYVDCDVEEPNGHVFLKPTIHRRTAVTAPVPEIDAERCTRCGVCATTCRSAALMVLADRVVTLSALCNGCGGCVLACPEQAIREVPWRIGTLCEGVAGDVAFLQGETRVGQTTTPEVIRAAIAAAPAGHTLVLDAPPGTTCPAVESMKTADVALLVAEPTPFGLNDLRLAVEVARQIGIPFAVAINRVGTGDHAVADFCRAEGIPVLLELPNDRRIAETGSRGELLAETFGGLRPLLVTLAADLRTLARPHPGRGVAVASARDPWSGPWPDGGGEPAMPASVPPSEPGDGRELVVVSGKGGTGKTSIAAALIALADRAAAVDCDADAANLHLVLTPVIRDRRLFVGGTTAVIEQTTCVECGICGDYCRFDAIWPDPGGRGYVVDPVSCEGCGVCVDTCPVQAVELVTAPQGEWFVSDTRHGPLVHARLAPGRKNSGQLVSTVRDKGRAAAHLHDRHLSVCDGSPGVGCSVIASLTGAAAALIVTEPTLSGLHDLRRVGELAHQLNVRAGVCVNKADLNPELAARLEVEAASMGFPALGRVRYDEVVTAAQVMRTSVVELGDSAAAVDIRRLWQRVIRFMGPWPTSTHHPICTKLMEEPWR